MSYSLVVVVDPLNFTVEMSMVSGLSFLLVYARCCMRNRVFGYCWDYSIFCHGNGDEESSRSSFLQKT
jgi:hypothetical protein